MILHTSSSDTGCTGCKRPQDQGLSGRENHPDDSKRKSTQKFQGRDTMNPDMSLSTDYMGLSSLKAKDLVKY